MKKVIFYIWKSEFPWDVRVEKICKSLVESGYKVFIICRWNNEDLETEVYKGINIIRIGFKKNHKLFLPLPFNIFWKKEIEKLIINHKPDLLIVREIMLAKITGNIGKKYNINVIMDMAENYPAAMKEWKKYNNTFFKRLLLHNLKLADKTEKNSVRLMNSIITVCDEQNQRLNSQFNFPEENLMIIHNTPDFEKIENSKIKNDVIVFGHHGYLTAEKSIGVFVEGFLLACEKLKNIELRIIGDGDCLEDFQKVVNPSMYSDKIKFLGKYSIKELPDFLKQIDIGILPYQINDFNNYTLHNKIFDYFLFGKPVLLSDTNPFRRIIKETNAGLCKDLSTAEKVRDSILEIVEINLSEFQKNSRLAFENKYNWQIDKENLINFIEKYI